ncbi:MAG: helix-turn-helix domain-containing protein [Lachnospiraceae bacterium]|nr:helix-turn-helix domain-containing protein [Lachnospiraceae bacterium]
MLTIKELSTRTGISEHHIRTLCKTNQIIHIRTGVKYLINYERFIDYLNGN